MSQLDKALKCIHEALDLENKAKTLISQHSNIGRSMCKSDEEYVKEMNVVNQIKTLIRDAIERYMLACDELMSLSSLYETTPSSMPLEETQKAGAIVRHFMSDVLDKIEVLNAVLQKHAQSMKPHNILHSDSSSSASVTSPGMSVSSPITKDLSFDKSKHELETRVKVAIEVRDTERTYNGALKQLVIYYMNPLSDILPQDDIKIIFGNLREIIGISDMFLDSLEKKLGESTASEILSRNIDFTIGDVFSKFSHFFKAYVSYANTQEEGTKLALKIINENKLAEEIARSAKTQGVQPVNFLCILPVQRIPRYRLLLEQIEKNTPKNHADYPLIERALNEIKIVASLVNQKLGDQAANAKILEIQKSLWTTLKAMPELLQPSRVFVREGFVEKLKSNGSLSNGYIFAFNDCIVLTKKSPVLRYFHFESMYEYNGASSGDSAINPSHLKKGKASFKITGPYGERVFVVGSAKERDEWIAELSKCVEETTEKRKKRLSRAGEGAMLD